MLSLYIFVIIFIIDIHDSYRLETFIKLYAVKTDFVVNYFITSFWYLPKYITFRNNNTFTLQLIKIFVLIKKYSKYVTSV